MNQNNLTFDAQCQHYNQRIDHYLNQLLTHSHNRAQTLHQAIRYTCLNGGKRIRALLVYGTGAMLGCPTYQLDAAAAAVELIHCYSLIHDDLPAMDNADYRRGQLACHKAFDEATAILAGDAQQALAFHLLAKQPYLSHHQSTQMMATLAEAALHMVEGQALDVTANLSTTGLEELSIIHAGKTAALIKASVLLGALAGAARGEQLTHLAQFGYELGLAFQIQDDILDVEGTAAALGKPTQADEQLNKVTYPALCGLTAAKAAALKHEKQACSALSSLNLPDNYLKNLAAFMIQRNY